MDDVNVFNDQEKFPLMIKLAVAYSRNNIDKDISDKVFENIKELKDIFEKIEKSKEDLKIKVLNIFTKIRTTLNERETQLLLEIDNLYKEKYFGEDIIKKAEKLPKQIKVSIEKGKIIDKEWDNDYYQ